MTTAEKVEKSRKLDEVVMRVRDGGAPLTRAEAWDLMVALAEGRTALSNVDTLRETVATLRSRAAAPAGVSP